MRVRAARICRYHRWQVTHSRLLEATPHLDGAASLRQVNNCPQQGKLDLQAAWASRQLTADRCGSMASSSGCAVSCRQSGLRAQARSSGKPVEQQWALCINNSISGHWVSGWRQVTWVQKVQLKQSCPNLPAGGQQSLAAGVRCRAASDCMQGSIVAKSPQQHMLNLQMRQSHYGRMFELTGQSCLCGHVMVTGNYAGPVSFRTGLHMSVALVFVVGTGLPDKIDCLQQSSRQICHAAVPTNASPLTLRSWGFRASTTVPHCHHQLPEWGL